MRNPLHRSLLFMSPDDHQMLRNSTDERKLDAVVVSCSPRHSVQIYPIC